MVRTSSMTVTMPNLAGLRLRAPRRQGRMFHVIFYFLVPHALYKFGQDQGKGWHKSPQSSKFVYLSFRCFSRGTDSSGALYTEACANLRVDEAGDAAAAGSGSDRAYVS